MEGEKKGKKRKEIRENERKIYIQYYEGMKKQRIIVNQRKMEAFEQTLSLQKDGDGGFCKNVSYWYSYK